MSPLVNAASLGMAMPHNRASMAVASLKYSYATDKVGTINAGYAVDRSVTDMSDLTGNNSIAETMNALYAEYSKTFGPVSVGQRELESGQTGLEHIAELPPLVRPHSAPLFQPG